MRPFFDKLFGIRPWKKEWQTSLASAVQEAQRGLAVNMVVVVARESDSYSEILFILTFLGMSLASLVGFIMRGYVLNAEEVLLFPLGGFAAGATAYHFRRFFITKIAPRAIKERVANKAKTQFFDHSHNMQGKLCLVYFSEAEKEALFLTSPEIAPYLNQEEIQSILSELLKHYNEFEPLETVRPCLLKLGDSLRKYLPVNWVPSESPTQAESQYYVGVSDRAPKPLRIPILKGSKDVN